MPLHNVTAQRAAGGGGQFEINLGAFGQYAERGAIEGFLGQIGVEKFWVGVERRKADTGDAQRIAFAQPRGYAGSFDRNAPHAAAVG